MPETPRTWMLYWDGSIKAHGPPLDQDEKVKVVEKAPVDAEIERLRRLRVIEGSRLSNRAERAEAQVKGLREALEFMRCCEVSGEAGADHQMILAALASSEPKEDASERADRPKVIEAALKAALDYGAEEGEESGAMEAAIRAADRERGMKEQFRARAKGVNEGEDLDLESTEEYDTCKEAQSELDDLIADADPDYERVWLESRLVTDWRQVEEGQ